MAVTVSATAAQAQAAALATDIGSAATVEFRTGAKPATPETAASGTLLGTSTFSGTWTASGGVLTSPDPAAVTAAATGTPGWFRIKTSGGAVKLDGTVTANGSGGDITFANTSWVAGGNIDLGVVTVNVPTS